MLPRLWNAYIKDQARHLGFQCCGITTADRLGRADYLRAWLEAGRAGSMAYLHRYFEQRVDPRRLMPGAQSVIVVALSYHRPRPQRPADGVPRGQVAAYAWGDDYHDVVREKLHRLADAIRERAGGEAATRVCVDTAPVLERELAARAGVGWIGKNTLVLNRDLGSTFFIGVVVTTVRVEPDAAVQDHCGSCTRCLEACPTAAFPAPYQMDASRCVSYLTIERREPVPESLQAAIGDWVFGCDVCQDVCPFNRHVTEASEPRFAPRPPGAFPALEELLRWTEDDYRRVLKGSAMKRATPAMLKRNAAIALRNVARE